MEKRTNDPSFQSSLESILRLVTDLVICYKHNVEKELRACGRSRLARLVDQLPLSNAKQLKQLSINDLPTANHALALAAASSSILDAKEHHFSSASENADVALIMLGLPLGQPLLDFIGLLQRNSVIHHLPASQSTGDVSFCTNEAERVNEEIRNMAEPCAEVTEAHFSDAHFSEFFKHDKPVVIRQLAAAWPAVRKWINPLYLKNSYGHRIVPVEYSIPGAPIKERFASLAEVIDMMTRQSHTTENVYMAQHPLLDYIPALRKDISQPHYMKAAGKDTADLVNLWMGSAGTGTKLHFDSADNILVQLVGRKKLVLIDPKQSHLLYPTSSGANISTVDVENPDHTKFPRFCEARGMTVYLEPGDALYMPAHYWHWVRAISSSMSINFWF
ncbi:Lysine-specific demethylase 8 [Gracilariopsis chorda]|uniref:Lysine-specific demethylase 8 n=1 Tax=Gracilariopsis chorda TaxID=448386 RepID=A0A2V3J7I6_9FLOR|nr:Lysine-specific demethylase 8 [Gracilariopsis chorda]|eukprot:PXF50183.1 Lysine-specific demethylase 8 [Gracilariopsis chorda]